MYIFEIVPFFLNWCLSNQLIFSVIVYIYKIHVSNKGFFLFYENMKTWLFPVSTTTIEIKFERETNSFITIIQLNNPNYPWKKCNQTAEACTQRCSVKKVLLEISQNSQENTCASLFFNEVGGWIKKDSPAQVFSCEFCEISKNTFSSRTPLVNASKTFKNYLKIVTRFFLLHHC